MFILEAQQHFDMTLPSLLKFLNLLSIPNKWDTHSKGKKLKLYFPILFEMPLMCVSLSEKATISLPKEQIQGEYIIYFINFDPSLLEKLGILSNGTSGLAKVEAKDSPKQWHN